MIDNTIFPHFISDIPKGIDAFEGRSQEKLARNICEYMRKVDAKADSDDGIRIPRIIGLEGGWGTGKSNVVRMIRNTMGDESYYTFTYDAWGHQEDLQRRSILETLTNDLITDKVLQGKVNIQMRNGKPHEDEWNKQLSLLLSNKTTTYKNSIPRLSSAAVWGIILVACAGLFSTIANQIWDNTENLSCSLKNVMALLYASPFVMAILLILYNRWKDGNWDWALKMVSQKEDNTVDEEYTSSEEPSVAEFKNWMKAISDHLGKEKGNDRKKKLIIVFDNMDRLHSEKVMQLWSSIYTFFAGVEFENIWAIIPYDYKHLCQAIYGIENKDGNIETKEEGSKDSGDTSDRDTTSDSDPKYETIKRFIEKTFPITYIVPQPVITDYKRLFNNYFEAAFGKGQHDQEHICQVFMQLHSNPNPRTIISFVNELVAMRMQWDEEKYRLQNLALYILKRDYLFHKWNSLEANLLKDYLFDQVSPLYPEKEKVRTQICQFAYGLDNEDLAKELPLRKELARNIKEGASLNDYVERPNFLTVLENVLNDVNIIGVSNAIKSLESIDDVEKDENFKAHIQKKWDMLTNLKATVKYEHHKYDKDITILIKHATEKRIVELCKAYCESMQSKSIENGADYYEALNDLQMALDASDKNIQIMGFLSSKRCEPRCYAEYLNAAKEDYKKYVPIVDNKQLNDYLLEEAIKGNNISAVVVSYIKDDKVYNLDALRDGLAKAIGEDKVKDNICAAAYINRVLYQGKGILKVRFAGTTIENQLQVGPPWSDEMELGYEDVVAMYMADGKDTYHIEDDMIPKVCQCIEKYMNYTNILKNLGIENSPFRHLNTYMIKHKKGITLDLKYAAKNLSEIQGTLNVDIEDLLGQFNRWPKFEWGELEENCDFVVNVAQYFQQGMFDKYKAYPGNFTDSIINLGVQAMSFKTRGFLATTQQQRINNRNENVLVVNSYWKGFVMTYLGTNYMKEADELLTNEAITMLAYYYGYDKRNDIDLLYRILEHPNLSTLIGYLHNLMNNSLAKTPISVTKFKLFGRLLPMLGNSMDQNTARGLITNFIKPIYKDTDCFAIIKENKDFYVGILKIDEILAAPIVKEINEMEGGEFVEDIMKDISRAEKAIKDKK